MEEANTGIMKEADMDIKKGAGMDTMIMDIADRTFTADR